MSIASIVADFNGGRQKLKERFLADEDPGKYLADHTSLADQAVKGIIAECNLSERVCVVALGGYGRQELFPYSDLDVLFLLPEDVLDKELKQVEEILSNLWSLGLTVGYSVRSIDECIEQAAEDITAQTAMLESRLICGDGTLFEKYLEALERHLSFLNFFRAKFIEQQQRHLKYQESAYVLEPNIKESPGGLRDLNILAWILKAYNVTVNEERLNFSPLLTENEEEAIRKATHTIFWLRIHMHLLTNRHEDRLIFEIQEELAKHLGVTPVTERRASEVLMQRYYRYAATVSNYNQVILEAIREKFSPPLSLIGKRISEGFSIRGETLEANSTDFYKGKPINFVLPFYLKIRHPEITKFSTRIYRAFAHLGEYPQDDFTGNQEIKEMFMKILKAPKGVYHALKEMAQWGVLAKLVPAFAKVQGQMQYDLFHAYTVDQHTMLAIRYLRHFSRSENAHEMPLCSELMMGLKNNWRVVVAMLFHDVGKGSGRDHSVVGAEEVEKFAATYGLSREDTEYIHFLVLEHLTLSRVAQKQDISDPDVVKAFAEKVKTVERLTGLYLLTVCDIRATSPKIWNGWKAKLLEELFYAAARYLKGQSISKSMVVAKRKEKVLQKAGFNPEQEKLVSIFWSDFDVAYFMRHSEEAIVWHAKTLLENLSKKGSIVATRKIRGLAHAHEVVVLTQDKPELFARIVSSLQKLDLSIMEARINTGRSKKVLDTFLVTDDGSHNDLEEEFKVLEVDLADRIDNEKPLDPLPRSRISRQSKLFPITPQVQVRPDVGGTHYLLNVVCADRRGLLAAISRVFVKFGINLVTARVMTLGERVEDVFLIENPKLKEERFVAEFETALLEAVEIPTRIRR